MRSALTDRSFYRNDGRGSVTVEVYVSANGIGEVRRGREKSTGSPFTGTRPDKQPARNDPQRRSDWRVKSERKNRKAEVQAQTYRACRCRHFPYRHYTFDVANDGACDDDGVSFRLVDARPHTPCALCDLETDERDLESVVLGPTFH